MALDRSAALKMNWLAHLLLSEPSPAFRIGNLLPDILSREELSEVPDIFSGGMKRHHEIDRFTDSHPIVLASIGRIRAPYRRVAPILIDVFYDHFLAREWHCYSPVPLRDFVAEVYRSIESLRNDIPPLAYIRLKQIESGDWLRSYHEVKGIHNALARLGQRFRKPIELGYATSELERSYEAFKDDFGRYFPELCLHVGVPLTKSETVSTSLPE